MSFTFAKFLITLRLKSDIKDRFAFFRMRSDFESAFRANVCTRSGSCYRCSPDCPYTTLFTQKLSSEPEVVKSHQKPALPFAFHLPVIPHGATSGTTVTLGLALAGKAINAAPQFITALKSMERPGFTITSLHSVGASGTRTPLSIEIEEGGTGPFDVLTLDDILATSTLPADRLKLTLVTPLRLVEEGRLQHTFDPARFLHNLIRRISSLARYHCDTALMVDHGWLDSSVNQLMCKGAYHYTDWQDPGKMRFTGVMGKGLLEGQLGDLIPFLLLGEHFNVGKGASFGLGRYRVEADGGRDR